MNVYGKYGIGQIMNLVRQFVAAGLAILVSGCMHQNQTSSVQEQQRRLCELMRETPMPYGESILIAAEMESDFSHYVYLVDAACPGEALFLTPTGRAGATPGAYIEAMQTKQKQGGHVHVRLRGVIVRDPESNLPRIATSEILSADYKP